MIFQIIAAVLGIVGCVITLATCLVKLTSSIASLETVVNLLKETVEKFQDGAKETHKEIFDELDEHSKTLVNHEARLQTLKGRTRNETEIRKMGKGGGHSCYQDGSSVGNSTYPRRSNGLCRRLGRGYRHGGSCRNRFAPHKRSGSSRAQGGIMYGCTDNARSGTRGKLF